MKLPDRNDPERQARINAMIPKIEPFPEFKKHGWIVEVVFNTDEEGRWVDEVDKKQVCFYGPFFDDEQAEAWMSAIWPDDTDVFEINLVHMNVVELNLD